MEPKKYRPPLVHLAVHGMDKHHAINNLRWYGLLKLQQHFHRMRFRLHQSIHEQCVLLVDILS
ncbi:Uncharacterised protein [Vibrio cholerae]|uniref:Uncharacterized protein n=1 Tax=Vibrio cholerae TaxID=666 RepID=A0A655Y9T4_VIBCL|nr:Uncharacterised protein [Vibrio cholerae]